tara:strand:+ start:51 stop:458 length:408 start_codon:yes stop_codon:yes gene_type:complete
MKKTLKIILSFIFIFIIINLTNGVVYSQEPYKTQSLRSFLIANVKILEQNINFEKRDLLNYNAGYSMGYVNAIHDLVDAVNNMNLKIKMHCKPKYVERITVYKNILKYIESNPNSLNQHPVNVVSEVLIRTIRNC